METIENKAAAAAAEKETKAAVTLNASVAPEDFDWDAFEGGDIYGADKSEISAAYDNTLSKIVESEVVEGEVSGGVDAPLTTVGRFHLEEQALNLAKGVEIDKCPVFEGKPL